MPTLERSLKTKPDLMTDMIPLRKEQASEFSMKKFCFACLHGGAAKLAAATLAIGLSLGAAEADQPGGKFGFPYPNFTGSQMTPQQFVQKFDAAMQTQGVFRNWSQAGIDIRKLNPSGVYLKHISLRTIVTTRDEAHPDYDWIHQNHPEWILRDANWNTVPLYLPGEECLDFGNDAYLDWVLNTWMPNNYLDSTDSDANKTTWYVLDNGSFLAQNINCARNDACQRYKTDAGVQSALKHLLDRFKARWPNKKILINTGTLSYMAPSQQLPWMKDVLSHSDGYFSETLTNDHSYWDNLSNSYKRNALEATLELADWLAANGKVFYPNLGLGDGQQPTQAETNYGFAFFNLMRRGNLQFYSQVMKDWSGFWRPTVYPEMNLPLGQPLEERQQISPNVYRRSFERATAYVNLSDGGVSISLPPGTHTNSLGQAVGSPLWLASFSGLTVYHSAPTAPSNPGGQPGTETGSITREVWTGISGYGVSSIPLGTAANFSNTPPSFEAPTNWADNYGTRMRGYITAPATGNYTFWIAGDDNSELWLSPNDNSANKMRIALVPGWTNSRQWDKYSTQKSAAINLTQGQRYYVEALQKEGGNADNLAVGWAKPGESTFAPSEVIPGSVLSPLF